MKLYSVKVKNYWFDTWVDDESLISEWRNNGVEIDEVLNRGPYWWFNLGLSVRLWCWLQDHHLVW